MTHVNGSWRILGAAGLCTAMVWAWPGNAEMKKESINQPAQKTRNLMREQRVAARQQFLQANPGVRFETNPTSSRIVGRAFGGGATPLAAAESFRLQHARAIGADPADLIPTVDFLERGNTLPLMYNPDTDSYKFTAVYYSQSRGGVPVFGSRLTVLVKNQPGFPIVLVNPGTHDLGDFRPDAAVLARAVPSGMLKAIRRDAEINELAQQPVVVSTSKVIWAGMGEFKSAPILADKSLVHNDFDRWLVISDARTGAILHKERQIYFQAVSGNTSGNATQGIGSEQCELEVPTPLPYLEVTSGINSTFADVNGNYSLSLTGATVNATIASGQWFNSTNFLGGMEALSAPASTPGDLFFNSANTNEQVRAQVNAYVQANITRDFALAANPAYPGLNPSPNFPITVNRTDQFCPGNAWYAPGDNGGQGSINFCLSGPGNPNTAWSSVINHEFGHHLVEAGGSGQGAYGEGMGDVIAQILGDDSCLGLGFFGSCTGCLRNGSNTQQYPCNGEIHFCGQLISGCLWDTRNELILTNPATYHNILRDLAINSILVHLGSSIDPSITNDYLVLDDDDGDLNNGTPHSVEILAGFGAHNMIPQPPPSNDACADAIPLCVGVTAGTTVGTTIDGAEGCTGTAAPDAWYVYRPDASGTVTISMCTGTTYDAVLSVHTGCPGTAVDQIACDDDGCGTTGGPSTVTFAGIAGDLYYVRVSGWSGSVGSFQLTVTGPNCMPVIPDVLTLSFPAGPVDILAPGVSTTMQVAILDGTEILVPGSALLNYRYNGGTYLTAPLTSLGGNLYEATFPAANCAATPEYYISADGSGGTTVFLPSAAPVVTQTASVGTQVIVLSDNFESNLGWVATNLGATSGDWQRGVPVNDTGWAYDPISDGDGSGQCYLTQNQIGNTDVDGGSVRLTSPLLDMSGGNNAIAYEYYLNLSVVDGVDKLLVEISSNGDAGPWTVIADHSTDGGTAWRHHDITQSDLNAAGVTLTSTMKVRFTANDTGTASIVEAGLDGFTVFGLNCIDIPGTCTGDITPPGGNGAVNIDDLVAVLNAFGPCVGCPEDITPPGGNGTVNIDDLVAVLNAFGACP